MLGSPRSVSQGPIMADRPGSSRDHRRGRYRRPPWRDIGRAGRCVRREPVGLLRCGNEAVGSCSGRARTARTAGPVFFVGDGYCRAGGSAARREVSGDVDGDHAVLE